MEPPKHKKKLRKKGERIVRRNGNIVPQLKEKAVAPSVVSFPPTVPSSSKEGYWLLASFVSITAGIFSLPNFHVFLPPESLPACLFVYPSLLLVGFILMFSAFRRLPEGPERSEMPQWQANFWFTIFFALCAFSRFYRPEEPPPNFWSDVMIPSQNALGVIDNFNRPWFFRYGYGEPLYSYSLAGLWELFPKATGIWINRVDSGLLDLGTIWGLYLLGSVLRGRRMGLILMAFWAFSMPMTAWGYFIMGQNTAVLACVWVMVFFFRLIQKPTFPRFIYWGLAEAFGAYNYVPFRPWAPVMVTAVLLWILGGFKEKPKGAAPWILLTGLWLSWIFLFFNRNNFLPSDIPWVGVVLRPSILAVIGVLLVSAYFKTKAETVNSEANRKVFGWATGSILAVFLSSPVIFSPLYASRTSGMSVFHAGVNLEVLKLIWQQVTLFFGMMFYINQTGLPDYPVAWHSYFESFPVLAMVVGLACFIAKPSWRKIFILFLVVVGMTPFVLSNLQHSGRVEGAVAPLFLLGAWGLDYFWELFCREISSGFLRKIVFLLIFSLWAIDAHWSFDVIRQWMAGKGRDALLLQQIEKDWKPYRLILVQHYPELVSASSTMICDQKEVYLFHDPNPIYVEPGEKEKDIVLLMYGYDDVTQNRIKKEFPQAQWSDVTVPDPGHPRFFARALIPFDSLSESKGKALYIQKVPHEYWRRRFYERDYGVARGLIWWDERVPSLTAPPPPGMDVFVTARADGEMTLPVAGDYTFACDSCCYPTDLTIDGKTVLDLKPQRDHPVNANEKIHLTAGVHEVSYASFGDGFYTQNIKVISPGGRTWILGKTLPDGKSE